MRRLAVLVRTLLRSAVRGLGASPLTTGAAVATLAVALLLVGAFALTLRNMEALLERFGSDLTLTVYLEDGIEGDARDALAARLLAEPVVERVAYVSKQDALTRFRNGVGARLPLLEDLQENPLPASFELSLAGSRRSPEVLRGLAQEIAAWEGVSDLGYGAEWLEGYARVVAGVRALAILVGSVLVFATLLIVANTIRLAIYSRRDEIQILGLVGAGRSFVAIPFLLEGIAQGLLGAALALALLFAGFTALMPSLAEGLAFLLGHSSPVFFSPLQIAALLAGGAALGLLGSAIALLGGGLR